MKISTKILAAYKTSKYGSKAANCADSFAISPDGLKLAVADGVSKSYLPKYVADALTSIYVSDEFKGGEIFNDENATPLLSKVIKYWDEKSKELEASVDEDTRFDLEDQRELYGMGASTFAGINLGEDAFTFDVLGDSCIFLFPYDAYLQPMILTSMPSEVDMGQKFPFQCNFGVHPHFLDTKGRIVGEPLENSIPPFDGIIVLATDAMSDWICRHYVNGQIGQLLQNFTNLNSPEEFADYINVLRDQDLKNDDVAIVIAEVNIHADVDSLKIYDESLNIDTKTDNTHQTVETGQETDADNPTNMDSIQKDTDEN